MMFVIQIQKATCMRVYKFFHAGILLVLSLDLKLPSQPRHLRLNSS